MLSGIIASLGGAFIDKFFGNALKAFEAYQNQKISMEELKVRLQTAMVSAAKEVEVSHSETLAKTYASFMGAVVQSKLMQVVWAAVTLSQLVVLVWHQLGIPMFVMIMRNYVPGFNYPGSGNTVEWAYLLLGACVGMGPMVLRNGPGAGNLTDRLKGLVGK
jgi:hypothetical protein